MRDPEELLVFGKAEKVVLLVYELTAKFPVEERYNLTSQIRRAAVSVSSNIVEGCSRSSNRDYARFLEIALGSAMELGHQLSLARRLELAPSVLFPSVELPVSEVCKMLNSFGRTLRANP